MRLTPRERFWYEAIVIVATVLGAPALIVALVVIGKWRLS